MATEHIGPLETEAFQSAVIAWYRKHGDRNLPWRSAGDGWAVLVAAMLLRKTTTSQVMKVYGEFLRRYPTPAALASASVEELREFLKPLGIENQRALLFKRLAEKLAELGGVPCDRDALKRLPGVGDYAASEVLLVACGRPEPLLDRNMTRVLQRVFGVRPSKSRPHTDPEMWALARSLVPQDPELAKELNFGVLDLARKICTARKPKCGECPLRGICRHAQSQSGHG